jgi:PAS domain S-box-containing protein
MRKSSKEIINAKYFVGNDEDLLAKNPKNAETMASFHETDISRMSLKDVQKLLFDLQTHQVELKMQNEELSRVQHDLTVSRDSYAQLYDLSPVAYLTLNEAGVIQKVNDAASALLGRSKSELIDKKFAIFLHPSDQDNFYLFFRGILATKTNKVFDAKLGDMSVPITYLEPVCQLLQECHDPSCGSELCDKRNLITYIKCSASVTYNESNALQVFVVIDNVTELKYTQAGITCLNEKLEDKILNQTAQLTASNLSLQKKIEELSLSKHQLMEREVKYNSIYNASVEGIITVGANNNIVSANAAVETIFGYKPEELKGCSINKLMPLLPEVTIECKEDKALTAVGKVREVEGLHKNGDVVFLDLSLVAFSTDKSRYFTHIVRDVSSRKILEQHDRQHLDQLAHVTRLGLMGEMASGIAHEVNQPLAAISNYTQASINLISSQKPDLEKLVDILSKTQQQALRAGHIIHRMRRFIKSHTPDRSPIDLNVLVQDAVDLCMPELKQNNITLILEQESNLPLIYVDKIQIEQVLINLIRNSVDAMQKQPLSEQHRLCIQTCLTLENDIQVRVKDNGHGIDNEQQQKILTPFYTTKTDGMGMGLSISRSLIEAHQGRLHFNSKPEKGTTFYFTLPLRKKSDER